MKHDRWLKIVLPVLTAALVCGQVYLLYTQNKLIEVQANRATEQNQKVDEQSGLMEFQNELVNEQISLLKDQNKQVTNQTQLMDDQSRSLQIQNRFLVENKLRDPPMVSTMFDGNWCELTNDDDFEISDVSFAYVDYYKKTGSNKFELADLTGSFGSMHLTAREHHTSGQNKKLTLGGKAEFSPFPGKDFCYHNRGTQYDAYYRACVVYYRRVVDQADFVAVDALKRTVDRTTGQCTHTMPSLASGTKKPEAYRQIERLIVEEALKSPTYIHIPTTARIKVVPISP